MTTHRGRSQIDDMARAELFRARVLAAIKPEWRASIQQLMGHCERRRPTAKYNTGTVSESACLYLAGLTALLQSLVIVEVGTFIGTSSLAMIEGAHVNATIYTCDKSNDCVPSQRRVFTHPFWSSTQLLRKVRDRFTTVDLFFFDGRIQPEDLPLILELSSERTVYAFDDYGGREKGVINVERLHPWLNPKKGYQLIEPPPSVAGLDAKTTIALLVPAVLL